MDFPFIERKRWQNLSPICASTMKVHWKAKTFAFTVLICRGFLTACRSIDNELKRHIEQRVQSEQLLQRDVRKYDEAPEWQLPEPGAFASAKSFRDKVVMPFVNKLKTLIKNLTIQCVRLKEEVIQLRKEKKRLSDDVEFYKGKIKDMSDRTELLQEKADDLERVKRYAGAEQIDTIIRKVKEQERTEQQIRRYDRSYGTR